jgi:hypothetical protein
LYWLGSAHRGELSEKRIWPALQAKSDSQTFQGFPAQLSWLHYLLVMKVPDESARSFYEIECAQEGWSTRELERQIGSMLFERLAKS